MPPPTLSRTGKRSQMEKIGVWDGARQGHRKQPSEPLLGWGGEKTEQGPHPPCPRSQVCEWVRRGPPWAGGEQRVTQNTEQTTHSSASTTNVHGIRQNTFRTRKKRGTWRQPTLGMLCRQLSAHMLSARVAQPSHKDLGTEHCRVTKGRKRRSS